MELAYAALHDSMGLTKEQASFQETYIHHAPCYAQLMGEGDIDGTQLLPWQQLHQGSVAALDICTETREVLLCHLSPMPCSLL